MSRKIKQQRIEILQKLAKKALTTEQSDSNLFDFSYCKNCGCPCVNDILCDDCDPLGYEADELDYSDFCGVQDQIAYQLKSGKSINLKTKS